MPRQLSFFLWSAIAPRVCLSGETANEASIIIFTFQNAYLGVKFMRVVLFNSLVSTNKTYSMIATRMKCQKRGITKSCRVATCEG